MRVTIILDDGFVSIDGVGYSGLDLSAINSSVHAVQWYGEDGEVELRNTVTRKMIENRKIISLVEFQSALDAWQARKDVEIAKQSMAEEVLEQQIQ
jgi:hypothetical protein